jgi:hypothetical protein
VARYEADLRPANGQPLEIEELLALLDRNSSGRETSVDDARACYLSSGDGWREAVKRLGGAFAAEIGSLTPEKGE